MTAINVNLSEKTQKAIKCIVWDLDNTLWHGTLLEGDDLQLNSIALQAIKAFDERGILQSIASKNDHATAIARLTEFGVLDYFLYPQIHWQPKSVSVKEIANQLNIGLDSFAFVDDQEFELDEVKHSHPHVLCINTQNLDTILTLPAFVPRFITSDSKNRRHMYKSDIVRKELENAFDGSQEEFLSTLRMEFTLVPGTRNDLQRAEELTLRTNQLNTTGYTYSYDELDAFSRSDQHLLLMATLVDKYGTYGTIGLALVEKNAEHWNLKLLLISCRVMSRGVGTVMLNHIINEAIRHKAKLYAEHIDNGRNRMMYMTYKLSGFQEVEKQGEVQVLALASDATARTFPEYINVIIK